MLATGNVNEEYTKDLANEMKKIKEGKDKKKKKSKHRNRSRSRTSGNSSSIKNGCRQFRRRVRTLVVKNCQEVNQSVKYQAFGKRSSLVISFLLSFS